MDQGQDPLAQKVAERSAPTVNDLWADYEVKHLDALAERSQRDIRSMWATYILPAIGNVKVYKLTSSQVDGLHRTISRSHKVRANRVVEQLRSALNFAIRWGWITKNPADGFQKNREQPRELFLTEGQIHQITAYLDKMPNKRAANVIRLLALTGARLGEALKAEWSQFDLQQGIWTKPSSHTKTKRAHRTPLSPEACELLAGMRAKTNGLFLFAGSKDKPITDIKRPWARLKEKMGLPALRIHDLRHTYASHLISSGETLPVIGRLLGHTQHQTTLRYSHLLDGPLRKATNKIGKIVGNNKAS